MTWRTYSGAGCLLAAVAWFAIGLGSCGEQSTTPATIPSPLADLTSAASLEATRGEAILRRGWTARLPFTQRIQTRVGALRSFVEEASHAPDAGAARDAVIDKGRKLLTGPALVFDRAAAELEARAPTIDRVSLIDLAFVDHVARLEAAIKQPAPLRVRIDAWKTEVTLGFDHLERGLTRLVAETSDAATEMKISAAAFERALIAGETLRQEIEKLTNLVVSTRQRRDLLRDRLAWAEKVAQTPGVAFTPDAASLIAETRAYVTGTLDQESDAATLALTNARAGAIAGAESLAARIDQKLDGLARAFLDASRKMGLPDPIGLAK